MRNSKKLLRAMARVGTAGVVLVLAGWLFGIRFLKFPGESMAPTVRAGQTLVAFVGRWHARSISRFDMVIFDLPPAFEPTNAAWHKVPWMKRLIGLPGEHIQIDSGGVFVNGNQLQVPSPLITDPNMQPLDVQLGTDEYFVIGDNPKQSIDSRSFGPLKRSMLKGYVWTVIPHGS